MIDRMEINLLPAEYRIRKRTLNIPRSIVYSVVIGLTLVIGAGFYTVYLRDTEAKLEQDIEELEKEIKANAHIQKEMNRIREEKKITDEKIKALQRISVNREKWVRLMEVLSGKLPPFTWLMTVKEEAGDVLAVEARSYSFPEVAHYMTKLEESEYINRVNLVGIEQLQGQDRKLYKFNITCVVNKDAGLSAVRSEEEVK